MDNQNENKPPDYPPLENKGPGMDVNINLDSTPILYTDNIFITAGPEGIVLDFSQKLITTNKVRIVARVGMSREHAKRFAEQFEAMLKVAEGKAQSAEKKIKTN